MIAPVNKIIPFSLVDGPGSRVAIFLQGCEFNCQYCHNPETISLCTACEVCIGVCPVGALSARADEIVWDRQTCCGCDACIQACPHSSSPKIRYMSPEQVMEEIAPQLIFARGITTSGGECTLHHDFLVELFRLVHAKGKTAFVDTNGQRDFREMPDLTQSMDAAMLDIKSTDEQEHRMLTGKSAATVLSNLEYLLEQNKLYEIRTVVVPGLLDNARTVDTASQIISRAPQVRYKLIKFRAWGVREPLRQTPSPSEEEMEQLKQIAAKNGVREIVIV